MSPKELADIADKWAATRSHRIAMEKEAALVHADEAKLKSMLLAEMHAQDITSIGGHVVSVTLKKAEVPIVENWEEFYKHVQETGDFDLMFRRVNNKAVKERWANTTQVPGVTSITVCDLSYSQVKGSK